MYLSFQYNTTWETNRTTFVFSISVLNIRHSVSNKFHNFRNFELYELSTLEYAQPGYWKPKQ